MLNAQHGSVVMNANGTITFAAEAGYAGRASFDYVVKDADGGITVGTTEVDVSRINLNPVAVDDSFTGYEDIAFIIQAAQLLVNDSDPDASGLSSLSVDAVRNASHGTVTLQADGSVRFQPDADYYGAASFDYRSNDGEGGQTWATAHLNLQAVNDAPVIEAIWTGWPVYGYQLIHHPGGGDGDPGRTDALQVQNEAQAQSLAAGGNLYSQTLRQTLYDAEGYVAYVYDYAPVAPSYYRNGMMRPIEFETRDGEVISSSNPFKLQNPGDQTVWPVDHPQRLNGAIVAYDPDGDSSTISFSLASTPQHGHAFINEYTVRGNMTYDTAHFTMVQQSGAWQYFSHPGDPYNGADPFSIRITDAGGAFTDTALPLTHSGSSAGGGGSCPIVMDLDGDGIELIRPEDSNVFIDLNADGWRERIGWAGKDDGVLTIDLNHDGQVDLDREIAFVGYKPGAQTDLDGLAAFDTDGDGRLTAGDAQWAQFGVFRDANGNGSQDAAERLTLDQMGITAISLQRHGTPELNSGNVVLGTAEVTYADGHTRQAGDVMFAGQGMALPVAAQAVLAAAAAARPAAEDTDAVIAQLAVMPAATDAPITEIPIAEVPIAEASGQDARLMQMALLFNQYCSAGSSPAEPLGVVDWAGAGAASLPEQLLMVQLDAVAAEPMTA